MRLTLVLPTMFRVFLLASSYVFNFLHALYEIVFPAIPSILFPSNFTLTVLLCFSIGTSTRLSHLISRLYLKLEHVAPTSLPGPL